MKLNRLLPLFLAVTFTGASAQALAGLKVVEQAIETSTYVVSLPDDSGGSMAVTSCGQCKPMLLRLTPRSRFLVGGAQVPYAEFLVLARGSGDKGLNIFYDRKTGTITRLTLSGVRRATPRQPSRTS